MNKTILIAGGTALVSLAAGGAGGFLYAKNKLGKEFDERLERELAATKKQYSIMLMEHEQKPSIESLVEEAGADQEIHQDNAEETPRDAAIRRAGEKALVDYSGASTKNGNKPMVIQNNIFADNDKRQKRPVRDPETGRFLPKQPTTGEDNEPETTPYIITELDFLSDEVDYDKEYLHYFVGNKTLVQSEDYEQVVEVDIVGEVNLTLFPEVEDGEESSIIVRNEVKETDYEIKLMHGDLAEAMGFGTEEGYDLLSDHDHDMEFSDLNQ